MVACLWKLQQVEKAVGWSGALEHHERVGLGLQMPES